MTDSDFASRVERRYVNDLHLRLPHIRPETVPLAEELHASLLDAALAAEHDDGAARFASLPDSADIEARMRALTERSLKGIGDKDSG